jgi:hypothetical protein
MSLQVSVSFVAQSSELQSSRNYRPLSLGEPSIFSRVTACSVVRRGGIWEREARKTASGKVMQMAIVQRGEGEPPSLRASSCAIFPLPPGEGAASACPFQPVLCTQNPDAHPRADGVLLGKGFYSMVTKHFTTFPMQVPSQLSGLSDRLPALMGKSATLRSGTEQTKGYGDDSKGKALGGSPR